MYLVFSDKVIRNTHKNADAYGIAVEHKGRGENVMNLLDRMALAIMSILGIEPPAKG